MKPFSIKFDGTKARIATCIEVEGQWYKKTLVAHSAEDLWEGLEKLLRIEHLPPDQKKEVAEYISKQAERACIAEALPRWLSKGGKIKVIPPSKGKLSLDEETKAGILEDLGLMNEDLELGTGAIA